MIFWRLLGCVRGGSARPSVVLTDLLDREPLSAVPTNCHVENLVPRRTRGRGSTTVDRARPPGERLTSPDQTTVAYPPGLQAHLYVEVAGEKVPATFDREVYDDNPEIKFMTDGEPVFEDLVGHGS